MVNKEQLDRFKKEIYDPYLKAWEIMGSLRDKDLDKQKTWNEWNKKCDKFFKTYDNEYCKSLYRVILDTGDYAMKIWKGR